MLRTPACVVTLQWIFAPVARQRARRVSARLNSVCYRRTNKALLVIWREGLFECREIVESPNRLLSSRLKSASCLSKFTQTWR